LLEAHREETTEVVVTLETKSVVAAARVKVRTLDLTLLT
jgi:hypothetical protein